MDLPDTWDQGTRNYNRHMMKYWLQHHSLGHSVAGHSTAVCSAQEVAAGTLLVEVV